MAKSEYAGTTRRNFLKIAAASVTAAAASPAFPEHPTPSSRFSDPSLPACLNPAYRLFQSANGRFGLRTHLEGGRLIEHRLTPVEAALVSALLDNKPFATLTERVADRYDEASPQDVREAIDRFLDSDVIVGDQPIHAYRKESL